MSNKELDHLTRLLSFGCPVTWGSESNTCETHADMGTTNHVEATGEDADVNDLGPIPMSSPPQHSSISHQEHACSCFELTGIILPRGEASGDPCLAILGPVRVFSPLEKPSNGPNLARLGPVGVH